MKERFQNKNFCIPALDLGLKYNRRFMDITSFPLACLNLSPISPLHLQFADLDRELAVVLHKSVSICFRHCRDSQLLLIILKFLWNGATFRKNISTQSVALSSDLLPHPFAFRGSFCLNLPQPLWRTRPTCQTFSLVTWLHYPSHIGAVEVHISLVDLAAGVAIPGPLCSRRCMWNLEKDSQTDDRWLMLYDRCCF